MIFYIVDVVLVITQSAYLKRSILYVYINHIDIVPS